MIASAMSVAVDALTAVPRALESYRALADEALLDLTRLAAEEVRLAQLHVSLLAGEIARRSTPELGSDGLAQRTGHRTAEELVRVTTGTRAVDARTAVRVGATIGGDQQGVLGAAVVEGRVSVAVADAVGIGLGRVGGGVSADDLDQAAAALLPRIEGLDADRAGREARALRDDLDLAGVAEREDARREQRSFRLRRRADGMGYAHWVLDPETYALVSDVFDRVTSPRRTGPHFTDARSDGASPADASAAEWADTRTPEQRASDVFAELLRHGAAADTTQLLGDAPIGVRIIVAATHLTTRTGRGYIEGHVDPVSIATVERHACTAGTITLTVDDTPDNAGQPLNLGRERRLFSRAQRVALAARDGGCRWPGCERPPSWCEAHHIEHWHRDHGKTNVADGILLCRHHHLLAHNNAWEITRAGPTYLLHPPDDGDPTRDDPTRDRAARESASRAITMPSRSRALHDALSA
ncbi:MAG: DUF222 domain-containing protein [Microcella sp.]|uniref:HNH endonuclease signature motif containing protein n=1 Tax=Microcella sp. TaxID=1913979 RepID=UPI0024C5AA67|nr:HNH endonuclease signature motif containing protein [Microcella sp.]UYN84608.1 MAG: DUF222 domain-containing protein [Microcella sp.]